MAQWGTCNIPHFRYCVESCALRIKLNSALRKDKLLVTRENMHLTHTTAHAVSSCVVRLSRIMEKDLGIRGLLSRIPHADEL